MKGNEQGARTPSGHHENGRAKTGWAQRARVAGIRRAGAGGAAAGVIAAALIAAGSASASSRRSTARSFSRNGVLTMGFTGGPISLNPYLGGSGPDGLFPALAYDTITWEAPNGTLYPDLATSWGYLGKGNRKFVFTLRPHVKYQDGATMTAKTVVASMNYFLKDGGSNVSDYAGFVGSVKAIGRMKVLVTYKQPNPDAAQSLDQTHYWGFMIGPKGLANPSSLLTSSDGTGQYEYDAAKSTANNTYYYTRNPHYWNPSAQMYSAISVKDILIPSAMLSAATTGQVQWALGNGSTEAAAKAAGLKLVQAPFFNFGLALSMRNGQVSPALANQDVREAIGYALNRTAMANAVGKSYATPSGQISFPGTPGYNPAANFTYNPAKARKLLAEGGYPHGFPLTILTEGILDPDTQYTQLIASALNAVGIKTTIDSMGTNMSQFVSNAFSKNYAAVVYPAAGTDMWQIAQSVLPVSIYNPADAPAPDLKRLLDRAYALPDGSPAQTAAYAKAALQFQKVAWFVPAFTTEEVAYVSPKLANVAASVKNSTTYPTSPIASFAWHPRS